MSWYRLILIALATALVHPTDAPSQVLEVLTSTEDEKADGAANAGSPEIPQSIEDIETKQAEFRKASNFPPPALSDSEEADPEEIRVVRLIHDIDSTYADQLATLGQTREVQEQLNTLSSPENWKEVSSIGDLNKNSITLKQFDQLHAIDVQLQENLTLAQQEIVRADRKLDVARKAYNRMDTERASGTGEDPPNQQLIRWSRLADEEQFILRQLEARLASLKRDLISRKVDYFEPFLRNYMDQVFIDEDSIQKQTDELNEKSRELEHSLQQAQDELSRAKARYEQFKATFPKEPSPTQSSRLLNLESLRQAAQARVSLNQAWINHHNLKKEFIQNRNRFFRGELDRAAMINAEEGLLPEIDRLSTEIEFLENEFDQTEKELTQRKQQLGAAEPDLREFLQVATDATIDRLQCIQEEIYSTEATLVQARTFLSELQTRTKRVDMESVAIRTGNFFTYLWDYELFRLNENRFTIATLVWVTLSLIAAYLVALAMGWLIGRGILPRIGFGAGGSAALQKLSFYLFLVIGIVIVFASFGFPLSSLTIASGILALAIGFGSQEVLKNFISGIILLIERPIHQGDVIQLDDRVLTVESIGARSTRMRDFDSTEKIVPNSYLIENIVTNRTLSDDGIRTTVDVGVAYGSPTRKTSELLMEATTAVEGVHENPKPYVIFSSFGDNALSFTIYFWTNADSRLSVSSEVRHRIGETLDEAGIVIAFPQRDVHLDSTRPIQVEVTKN
jgi:potassium efflux system protein